MKNIKIVCDFREDFNNFSDSNIVFNDHPTRKSVEEICRILNACGYNSEIFGGVNQLIEAYRKNVNLTQSLMLNMSDGLTQPYSRIQVPMLCEMLNANYSGSPIFAVALMNNKHYSKIAVNELNINIPIGILINNNLEERISISDTNLPDFPLIVKPNTECSSLGISQSSVCYNMEQLINALNESKKYTEVVIEEYIPGYEITDLIIGNPGDYRFNEVILTSIYDKIILSNEVLGLREKSQKLRKQYPANKYISAELCSKIKETSLRIFEHFGARDIARIDYRVTVTGEIYFLEMNSVPRVSSTSECAIICQEHNILFDNILIEYIDTIIKRISSHEKK